MKDYLPLIVGSLSAVTVVLVAFLGSWLGRRNEHARWLREQRLEVCAEWVGVLGASLLVASRLRRFRDQGHSDLISGTSEDLAVEARELRLKRSLILSRLKLLASPKVRVGAEKLLDVFHTIPDADLFINDPRWDEGVEVFSLLVRSELGSK
jgi:hypothetical protein